MLELIALRCAQRKLSGESTMSQIASPSRSRAGEEGLPVRPAASRLTQAGLAIGLLLTVVVLTVNVWLSARMAEDVRRSSREHAFWVICQPGHSAAERAGAFLQLAAAGNKEWRSADLRDLNLARVKLTGVDLSFAQFDNANLAGADLAGARVFNCSFAQADLSGANLSEADLSQSQFYRANLRQTKLRRAKLRAAWLQEAQAEKADFILADLSDANCLMANLTGAQLTGADLSGANLEAAVLRGANLSLVRMDGAKLKDADFTNANWWHARGLSVEQINLLKKQFPPATNAEPALKLDYDKWVSH